MARRPHLVVLLVVAVGCANPLLDAPAKLRHDRIPGAPLSSVLASYASSEDGTSVRWTSFLGVIGRDVESRRKKSWLFPLWYRTEDPPYSDSTLIFPLYFGRNTANERWRFFTPLYGWIAGENSRADYVLGPVMRWERSYDADVWSSSILAVYDWRHRGSRNDLTVLPLLGLAHLGRFEWGFPPDGETVGAGGRESSRRIELLNLLGIITLFGYDDVGDRREIRLGTLFSSEMLSPLRSWRGRGDDPFVREWVFPLYMNVRDEEGGWFYVGPLWGRFHDDQAQSSTDWWLAGLVARTRAPEGTTWRLLGLPIVGP